MVCEDSQEIAVDTEHDSSTAEFEESKACLAEAEDEAAESHGVEGSRRAYGLLKVRRGGVQGVVVVYDSLAQSFSDVQGKRTQALRGRFGVLCTSADRVAGRNWEAV